MKLARPIAALLIALAAFFLQRGATLGWGTAVTPDAAMFRLSPIGMERIAAVDPVNATVSCRWWPKGGDEALCTVAAGGEDAATRLRLAYPALTVALWVAVTALFLQVLRLPRSPMTRAAITWVVGILATAAILLLATNAPRALAVLAGARLRFGEVGFTLVAAAAVCAGVSGTLELLGSSVRRKDA